MASQCLQRRESSALTSTSEAASAVGKSLLLDTLNLVRPDPWDVLRYNVPEQQHVSRKGHIRVLLVNMQMRRFEKIGLTRAQSEQMTEMLTEVVCLNKEKVVQQFVSKPALEKVRRRQ